MSQSFVDDERDIADVIANEPTFSLAPCYNSVCGQIEDGLRSYAKSTQILNVCNGLECSWEVSFSENFKVESNLTSDFKSLRQLKDYAISLKMLDTETESSMAKRAGEMLNKRLLEDF